MDLNTRVEKIMEYAELTPSEFAHKIGVNPSNISQIINRRNKPSLDLLTKIKNQFPELEWEWIIEDKGEMTKNTSPFPPLSSDIVESKFNSEFDDFTPSENLFNLLDEENIKLSSNHLDILNIPTKEEAHPNLRESDITIQSIEEEKITDSQQLENNYSTDILETTDNQNIKIKKIVFFYDNGKFEVFEP